jgi:hypothetical protein
MRASGHGDSPESMEKGMQLGHRYRDKDIIGRQPMLHVVE